MIWLHPATGAVPSKDSIPGEGRFVSQSIIALQADRQHRTAVFAVHCNALRFGVNIPVRPMYKTCMYFSAIFSVCG